MTEQKEKKPSRYRIPIMVAFFSLGSLLFIGMASAGPIQDIPYSMAEALGTSPGIAGMILSSAILVSVGLAMAMVGKRANTMATIIIIISTEGVLTGIGWLDPWLLLLTGVLVAATFAGKIKDAVGM